MESLYLRRAAGVEMIVAIDSTRLGPALGGCRWQRYRDAQDARDEACALARAMTRKAAMARLRLGGGKAVVCGDPARRTRDQLLAFGEVVEGLGGRYITAADMGTGEEEMAVISEATSHVIGLPERLGGCGSPSPFTAEGVLLAIEVALEHVGTSLRGSTVAVQGFGAVGSHLVAGLIEAGARVIVSDTSSDRLRAAPDSASLRVVPPNRILGEPCDVFAPCGPARVLDGPAVEQLRCAVVCGAANNPLADPEIALRLASRGILYVPDFVANAGGLIHLAVALEGGDAQATRRRLAVIPENLEAVLERVKSQELEPHGAAERIALSNLA